MNSGFEMVGILPEKAVVEEKKPKLSKGRPVAAAVFLALVVLGCVCCRFVMTKDPTYMDLKNCSVPPGKEFIFGTDTMGRDIFSMVWYGGRLSLFIGVVSAFISTAIAVVVGSLSGCASKRIDSVIMRFTDIFLSIPEMLSVVFLQALLGNPNAVSIALVVGLTSWSGMAKVVRAEVKKLKSSGYMVAARCMGGGFFHVLVRHLIPNFFSSIMFMAVMYVRSAIVAESTLSFMGLGLPLETVSWGSMLSLAQKALLTDSWWIIVIPGVFLVGTLMSLTSIGNYMRKISVKKQSNL